MFKNIKINNKMIPMNQFCEIVSTGKIIDEKYYCDILLGQKIKTVELNCNSECYEEGYEVVNGKVVTGTVICLYDDFTLEDGEIIAGTYCEEDYFDDNDDYELISVVKFEYTPTNEVLAMDKVKKVILGIKTWIGKNIESDEIDEKMCDFRVLLCDCNAEDSDFVSRDYKNPIIVDVMVDDRVVGTLFLNKNGIIENVEITI